MKPVGTGAFHAGVEVFSKEWSYGYAIQGSQGVYHCKPRSNDRHRYRESVAMGGTCMTEVEVISLIQDMRSVWVGTDYEILTRNCCHFADAFCRRLGVGPAPRWLMHLAGAGVSLVNGVEKAVMHTHSAVTLAAEKAGELDDRYRLSDRAGEFLSREVNIDEDYLGAKAQEVFEKALEHLAPVGELAERVIDEAMKPMSPTRMDMLWGQPRASLRVSPGALFRWCSTTETTQEALLPAIPNRQRTGLPTVMEVLSPRSVEIEEVQDLQDPRSVPAKNDAGHDLDHDSQTVLLETHVADKRDTIDSAETSVEAAAEAGAAAAAAAAAAATREAPATLPDALSPLTTISESAWPLPLPTSTLRDGDLAEEQSNEEEEDERTVVDEELQEVQGEHQPEVADTCQCLVPVAKLDSTDSEPSTLRV